MEFSTKVNIPKSPFDITHNDKLLLLGSCFTENIGNYLNRFQYKTAVNPFGIIYNPISIFNSLEKVTNNIIFQENNLIQHQDLFISLEHHGVFSGIEKNDVLKNINEKIELSHHVFNASKYIVITLGTSFVYEHLEQKKIVANCHKIPNKEFEKRLLSIDEIVSTFENINNNLQDKKIIFTVSPVRHWRDGAIENQRSKSILIESIHQIISKNNNCFYFPAYEIMMDELRDYRFYNEDMLHPNSVAVKYIWQRFAETYFNEQTNLVNKRIEKINLLLQHRTKNENTVEDKNFALQKQNAIQEFKATFPDIDVTF